MTRLTITQALDGASIDGSLYSEFTDFARHTHWSTRPWPPHSSS